MQSTDTPFSPNQKQPPLDADLNDLVKEIRESFLSFLDRSKAEHIQTDQDELTLDRNLAVQLCTSLGNRPQQLAPLSLAANVNVLRWLRQLIRELCHNRRFEDALQLQERSTGLTGDAWGIIYRPLLLLMAGQEQTAWQAAKSEISHSPPPPDLVADIVEMYIEAGKFSEAENLTRMMLRRIPPDLELHAHVQSHLIRILYETGRHKEARHLDVTGRAKHRALDAPRR